MFTFEVEEVPFEIVVSDHAEGRMRLRKVEKYAAYGSIVSLGENLLDMNDGEEFCIMDKELDISVCCALHYEKNSNGMPIMEVTIVTVLDSSMFFVKDGVRVYKLEI